MALRVVIIATPGERFHRHLCAAIARRFDVVGVLHPAPRAKGGGFFDLAAHRQAVEKRGLAFHVLQKLASNKVKSLGWDLRKDVAEAETALFPDADADYAAFAAAKARLVEDINGPEAVRLLTDMQADVVVNSGGPILKRPLLAAAPLMLNYHTGVSPLYNGSESVFWTFANGQPHITGGTLMVMNEGVDAGPMLAHYLPAVEAGDTPGRQFMKAIAGGVELYCRFLDHLSAGRSFVAAPQGRSFFYSLGADWSVHQNLMIERRVKQDIAGKFARPERIGIYWDKPGEAAAIEAARAFLSKLVYDP
ncbi:MAG: hypothetical protein HXY23_01945 [Parvularculaceae bacterium]|jgi:methionyl-tRNA formyltransferase|nr:hypothetical protein [Parvularculaceae bacterium]